MSDFDLGAIFFSDQGNDASQQDNSPTTSKIKYREFLRTFRVDEDFVYRRTRRPAAPPAPPSRAAAEPRR